MSVDGFKVIEGSKGLFVSVPSHKGTIVEDGQRLKSILTMFAFLASKVKSLQKS